MRSPWRHTRAAVWCALTACTALAFPTGASAAGPATTYTLTISTLSPGYYGSGSVSSSPAGIGCDYPPSPPSFGQTGCTATFDAGTEVTLSATPNQGFVSDGWIGGGCQEIGPCTIVMSSNVSLAPLFTVPPPAWVAPLPVPVSQPPVSQTPVSQTPVSQPGMTTVPPACTLRAVGDVVAKRGAIVLEVTCNQTLQATVSGTLSQRLLISGRAHRFGRARRVHLVPVYAAVTPNQAVKIILTVPPAVMKALERGSADSVSCTLAAANGTATTSASARIAHLVWRG